MLGTFGFVAALLTFAIGVPAMFLLPLVQRASVDPLTLVTSGWLPRAFGLMLACQLPGLVLRVRHFEVSGIRPEKMGMDAETGFVLHRVVMLAVFASMLAVFGRFALPALVILSQVFGAGTEIMRDEYVRYLMGNRRGAAAAAAPPQRPPSPTDPPPRRRNRKRR